MTISENTLAEIFTDIDTTIFSEGSLDPLGLRIIWTSLGNKIFKNRLNTISSNIRSYTINLFHHSIIYDCQKRFDDKILNITGSPPYNNKQQLYEGLILFLESTLIHAICKLDIAEFTDVPGTSKLKAINRRSPEDSKAKFLFVDRNTGILVRHIGLGIHGRHKGPFQQIGLFSKTDYYADTELWEDVQKIFNKAPWKSLADRLIALIDERILSPKMRGTAVIKLPKSVLEEFGLTEKYRKILDRELFRSKELILFWENKLGLLEGAAGELYKEVKKNSATSNYEEIIKNAVTKCHRDEKLKLEAICAIEPFISFLQKTISLLLIRGTDEITDELKLLLRKWIKGPNINIANIMRYESQLDPGSKVRLTELLNIYESNFENPENLVKGLIAYHEKIMDIRGNNNWISISENGKIKLHHPANYSENYIKSLKSAAWVNSYYLPTLERIYDGLHNVENI
ncbi:MAG: hypothetical protein IPO16_07340 [Saprospiraceae bacterium]|nr:hypothetical protein [Saprospiraceae bacterium]